MTTQEHGEREGGSADVPDFTGGVSRRRLIRRGAVGAGLAVAGGALLRPGAASANDGDPVLAGQTVSNLTAETGLNGSCTTSVLHLTQASTADDGLIVELTDSSATGTGISVSQAGSGAAIDASAAGSSTASAITAEGTAALAGNNGVIEATNNSTTSTTAAVRAVSSAAGSAISATASTAPAVNAKSNGSGAALFANNTSTGPAVSATTSGTGTTLLLTSGGTAILASSTFSGTPSGDADKAGISITTDSSNGTYVKAQAGRAIYAESHGAKDTVYVTNLGTTGNPHAVTAYLSNVGNTASAVYGSTAGTGAGIEGRSDRGRGGQFTGRVAQIRLLPGTGPHPSSGSTGDLYLDNKGALWFCKGGANWKQLA